jgi:hypothetical protein
MRPRVESEAHSTRLGQSDLHTICISRARKAYPHPQYLRNFPSTYAGPAMPPKRELRSKRKRTADATSTEEPESQPQPPVKRQKRSSPARSKTPPEFWDNLSKVPLCRRALREHYRRTLQPVVPKQRAKRDVDDSLVKQVKRFARRGGPDLRMIRGVSPVLAREDHADFYSTQIRNRKTRWAQKNVLDQADPASPAR